MFNITIKVLMYREKYLFIQLFLRFVIKKLECK